MTLPCSTSGCTVHLRNGLCTSKRNGPGTQEWRDGSKYEGEFVNGLKQGTGIFTWPNGEFYKGAFYKDYRHGSGTYSWPNGAQFTGKFYLNRKQGYGVQRFPDGTTFQGLYHADERFGPGVTTYPDGRQDVGLWYRHRLIRVLTCVGEGFTLRDFPEYMNLLLKQQQHRAQPHYTEPQVFPQPPLSQERRVGRTAGPRLGGPTLPQDEWFVLPPGIESYSTDADHLPTPQSRQREQDLHFFGRGDVHTPSFSDDVPPQRQMEAHIHTHRFEAKGLDWDVAAVLAVNRERFGDKGPVELASEKLITAASLGLLQNVNDILISGKVHPDVCDAKGITALIAATVNCHNGVIHLLLDSGADVNKVNDEGMSALAVSNVLYYPFCSLYETVAEKVSERDTRKPEIRVSSENMEAVDPVRKQPGDDGEGKLFLPDKLILTEQDASVCEAEDMTAHVKDQKSPSEGEDDLQEEVQSVQLLDGNIPVGAGGEEKEEGEYSVEDRTEPVHESTHSVVNSVVSSVVSSEVNEDLVQQMAEDLRQTDLEMTAEPQDTVHKMPLKSTEHHWTTMQLLLSRGADPNASSVPMPVLFLAIKAAHAEGVQRLLGCGARTDLPLPAELKGLYPLHVAAGLPGPAGPKITELLLHTAADPDVKAQDGSEVCELDKSTVDVQAGHENGSSLGFASPACFSTVVSATPEDAGRTPLHVACQRDSDYTNAKDVVFILLAHKASTGRLWSGHSPLSLAIASGNDLAVDELLAAGADPNLPLSRHVGSALCAAANISYDRGLHPCSRIKLVEKLMKAGANILMPVVVGEGRRCATGTAVDYAQYSFNQDRRVAHTPYHALTQRERDTYNARRHLLSMMGDLLRRAVVGMEKQRLKEENQFFYRATPPGNRGEVTEEDDTSSPTESYLRKPPFKYCYQCGRSIWVVLTACSRCHEVFYCSKTCKMRAWSERHKEECVRVPGRGSRESRYSSGTQWRPLLDKSSWKGQVCQDKTDREDSSRSATQSCLYDPDENYSFI